MWKSKSRPGVQHYLHVARAALDNACLQLTTDNTLQDCVIDHLQIMKESVRTYAHPIHPELLYVIPSTPQTGSTTAGHIHPPLLFPYPVWRLGMNPVKTWYHVKMTEKLYDTFFIFFAIQLLLVIAILSAGVKYEI
jgi:hypothetical protein